MRQTYNALIPLEPQWSRSWLLELGGYIDLSEFESDTVMHLYEAVCSFLYWRHRMDVISDYKYYQGTISEIIQGYGLYDIDREKAITPYWESLYMRLILPINHIAITHNLHSINPGISGKDLIGVVVVYS